MSRSDSPMPVLWRDRKNGAVAPYRGGNKSPDPSPTPRVSFWWPMRERWWQAALAALCLALLSALVGWLTATVRYEAAGRVETWPRQTGQAGQPLTGVQDVAGVLKREVALIAEIIAPLPAGQTVWADITSPSGLTLHAAAPRRADATDLIAQTLEHYQKQTTLPAEVQAADQAAQVFTQLQQHRARRDESQRRIDQLQWDDQGASLLAVLEAAQRNLTQREEKLAQIQGWLQQAKSLAVSRQTKMVVLAETDPAFAELLIERSSLLAELVSLLRGGSEEPAQELRDQWIALQIKIDAFADDTAVMPASWVGAPQDEQRLVAVRRSTLRDQHDQAQEEVKALQQDVADLGARHRQLQTEQDTLRQTQRAVQTAEDAYTAIKRPAVALELTGTRVTHAADIPTADNRLERILSAASLGALTGLLGVVIWAFADNRWRRADPEPWTVREAPLVGVVPDVNTQGPQGDEPPTDAQARTMRRDLSRLADAVHAIRAVIEAQLRDDKAQTICITSASRDSGKTSLTVGLASSLVMGGMRVLVVDASLTDRTTKPKPTDDPAGPNADGQTLDDVLISMDYLDAEDRDLLTFPDEEAIGLGAYLRGAALESTVIRTRVAGLSLLSGVGVQPGDAGRLSRPFLQQMAMEAREHYDAVLFDTGSIPRCVEALFVAGACNGVLMVVGHGEKRRAIDHALERLQLVGARVIGTVFNRDRTKPDAAEDFDSGGTIDPSWRDQGSGMFAAAIRTHGGQTSTYDAPKGQTGMLRGTQPTPDELPPSPDDSRAGSHADPIDFSPTPPPPLKTTPKNKSQNNADALRNADATRTGNPPPTTKPDITISNGVIDEYIDSVLSAADSAAGIATPQPLRSKKTPSQPKPTPPEKTKSTKKSRKSKRPKNSKNPPKTNEAPDP